MLKFLYRVNDEMTRDMFEAMVASDKNSKQIREKIVADIQDDFDRIDGKPTKKELEEKQKQLAAEEKAREEAKVAELQRKLAEMKALTKQAEDSKAAFGAPPPAKGPKSPALKDSGNVSFYDWKLIRNVNPKSTRLLNQSFSRLREHAFGRWGQWQNVYILWRV